MLTPPSLPPRRQAVQLAAGHGGSLVPLPLGAAPAAWPRFHEPMPGLSRQRAIRGQEAKFEPFFTLLLSNIACGFRGLASRVPPVGPAGTSTVREQLGPGYLVRVVTKPEAPSR